MDVDDTSCRPVVPQELIDKIIDELQEEREVLKTCALICRSWLHRSRCHLHYTVILYHQHCRIHPTQINNICTLLSLPAISEYTRELRLEGKTDYGLQNANEGFDNGELFWRVIARFSHVKTVRITRLFWVSHSLDNKNRLCAAFHCVTALDVYMSDFADCKEFLSFLTGFPRLSRLKVERVYWAKSAAEWYNASGSDPSSYRVLPADASPGIRLTQLHVQHCDMLIMADIAKWLASAPSPPIEALHLSPPDSADFDALPLYFDAIGTNLKHLTLALEFSTKEDTLRRAVAGLEASTRLQSLTLLANYGFGREFVRAASVFWPCVIAILTELATEHLHTIRFECLPEDLIHSATRDTDALLTRASFSSLSTVAVVLGRMDGHSVEQLDELAQIAFQGIAARGCLQVFCM